MTETVKIQVIPDEIIEAIKGMGKKRRSFLENIIAAALEHSRSTS